MVPERGYTQVQNSVLTLKCGGRIFEKNIRLGLVFKQKLCVLPLPKTCVVGIRRKIGLQVQNIFRIFTRLPIEYFERKLLGFCIG